MPVSQQNRNARLVAADKAPAPEKVQEDAPEPEVVVAAPQKFIPVPYYNPKVLDEQFLVGGSPYKHYFNRGRYVAKTEVEEAAVRAALRAHGPDKPDRWRGDDRKPWTDRRTGFSTGNENAKDDFEFFHQD